MPITTALDIPSVEMDNKIENEIAVILWQLRALGKRKQFIFLCTQEYGPNVGIGIA